MMNNAISILTLVIFSAFLSSYAHSSLIDYILIEKANRKMTVYYQKKPIKSYKIALGFEPKGHKQQEGDGKTPEGRYSIISKNPKSQFHLSLKISYPNSADKEASRKRGVTPGGDIMIHGLPPAFKLLGKLHTLKDWTLGCIAVTNQEIDEIFASTPVGTPVEIRS